MKTVAVLGAGTMGRGIAQSIALAGYQTYLYDITPELLHKAHQWVEQELNKGVTKGKIKPEIAAAAQERLLFTTTYDFAADCQLVIEAVPENISLKRQIFTQLDELCPETTLFASNTSSLSITAIAATTQRPDRFLGLHFFNPAHLMKLVEIIRGDLTSGETVEQATHFVHSLGKISVLCQDTPAFIVNRVARPFYGEAFRLLGENVADAPTIDQLARSLGFAMGPFELVDLIGCDVNFAVTQSVYEAYFQDPKYRPHPIQRRMVESNRLGRKTGQGFYRY